MFDHNSFEWAVDENIDFYKQVVDVTFSNNIVAQGLHRQHPPQGRPQHGDAHQRRTRMPCRRELRSSSNLFAFNYWRNPWVKHGQEIEFTNNYIYGVGDQSTYALTFGNHVSDSPALPMSVNIIGNYYEAASYTENQSAAPITLHQ